MLIISLFNLHPNLITINNIILNRCYLTEDNDRRLSPKYIKEKIENELLALKGHET